MRRRAALASQSGMTLTELIVVSFILIVLSGVSYAMARYQGQTFRREQAKAMTQGDLRIWLARMVNDIRKADYDPRGTNQTTPTFTVQTFTSTQFTFTTDANSDGSLASSDAKENLGYRLNGSSLQLWQGGTSWRTVLNGVTALRFDYEDGRGAAITGTTKSDRLSISAVQIALTAQATAGASPEVAAPIVTAQATATLRNPVY